MNAGEPDTREISDELYDMGKELWRTVLELRIETSKSKMEAFSFLHFLNF